MEATEALRHWLHAEPIRPTPDAGLINRTWLVGEPPCAVLQWVNPIFDPQINLDIAAVAARLETAEVPAPRLLPTADGKLWVDDEPACWRLMTYLPGVTLHRLENPLQAAQAGALVGRFHSALTGFDHVFSARPRRIHDTPARMAELQAALAEADGHPLADRSRELGASILERWATWDGDLDQPERLCHGDLKISNLRFDEAGRATGILDLDTLEAMPIVCEMGDAWRSWCNPAGEDQPEAAHLDVELFEASARAWLKAAPEISRFELDSLVPGIERICLELAGRFCADAVRNTYFREDRERHARPGEHNLLRARGQLNLAASVRAARRRCERAIGLL